MDIKPVQSIGGNDSLCIKKQPECDPYLFEETDRPEFNPDMLRERVDCGRKKYKISVLQTGEHLVGVPADAADQRKKIIGYDSCSNNAPLGDRSRLKLFHY
jgi:hypothetical protein